MHLHMSCSRNGDNHILSIKTGNVYRQRVLPQTITNTFKMWEGERLKHNQNDGSGQMVVAFTIAKLNYLIVSLFCDLVRPFSQLYLLY